MKKRILAMLLSAFMVVNISACYAVPDEAVGTFGTTEENTAPMHPILDVLIVVFDIVVEAVLLHDSHIERLQITLLGEVDLGDLNALLLQEFCQGIGGTMPVLEIADTHKTHLQKYLYLHSIPFENGMQEVVAK